MNTTYLKNIALSLSILTSVACFASGTNVAGDSSVSVVANHAGSSIAFDSKGVATIVLGTKLSRIPSSVSGLYERFVAEDDEGFHYIDFFDRDGNVVFSAITTHGVVTDITAATPIFKTTEGVYVGMPVEQLKKLPGVEEEVDGSYYLNLVKFTIENGQVRYMTASKFL